MKALILDGVLTGQTITAVNRRALVERLAQIGWQVQPIVLREQKIAYCLGCCAMYGAPWR